VVVTLSTSIWIHIGEVLRAVIVVLPRVKDFFENRAGIAELAPKTLRGYTAYSKLKVYSAPIRGAENLGKLIARSFLATQP